jgi:CheY-like chemotaxis protein
VELPLCDAPADAAGKAPRTLHTKVLLVEDNDDTRTMLAETLERLAYDVLPAGSGEVALDILGHEVVDVIVADIGLPGMDGYEFLRRARGAPTRTRSVAFALTGYGQESDVRRAHDAGYVEHLVKPLEADEIDRRIRARLATRAPAPSGTERDPADAAQELRERHLQEDERNGGDGHRSQR